MGIDLGQPFEETPRKPARRARFASHQVSAEVVEKLGHLLRARHVGRDHAARSPVLLRELAEMGLPTNRVRDIGEAADELLDTLDICSTSARGYWIATCAEDLEESLAESDKRARKSLRRRSRLKMRLREWRGQRQAMETA